MWQFVEKYFSFSRGERRATLAIVITTVAITGALYAYDHFKYANAITETEDREMAAFIAQYESSQPAAFIPGKPARTEAVTAKSGTININTADSATWEKQKGIGPVLARRIVKFRTALGGFVSVEQISEVYGLPDSTYRYLKPKLVTGTASIRRININISDEAVLNAHPYISSKLAKAISGYRLQNGNFRSVAELRHVEGMNDSLLRSLQPYLSVE